MGAGPLLPVRAIIHVVKKALVQFLSKKLKQSKHLDVLQHSSTVDDRIVLPLHDAGEDDGCKVEAELELTLDVDNMDTDKVRGIEWIPFVTCLFSLRLSLGSFYDYSDPDVCASR